MGPGLRPEVEATVPLWLQGVVASQPQVQQLPVGTNPLVKVCSPQHPGEDALGFRINSEKAPQGHIIVPEVRCLSTNMWEKKSRLSNTNHKYRNNDMEGVS